MFPKKTIMALVGVSLMLTSTVLAKGTDAPKNQQKGKPVVMVAKGADAPKNRQKGKPVVMVAKCADAPKNQQKGKPVAMLMA